MHSITLNQNWKKVRVTLDPPQKKVPPEKEKLKYKNTAGPDSS
jgi:hypothetical protein